MGKEKDEKSKLEEKISSQENTIATLKAEAKKHQSGESGPRVIIKGDQKHPKYRRNKIKISPVMEVVSNEK